LQLDRQLDPYAFSQDALSDALTVADQTIGPRGDSRQMIKNGTPKRCCS
jgi:hypothetical protein